VDPGESDFQTALRETLEESGYLESDLKIYQDYKIELNYLVKNKPKIVIYWLAELINLEKDPKLSEEHTEFKFLSKSEAKIISGYEDFSKMLDHFENVIKNL
jgi:bis(5'-nucleosidyl)-tetraphosphatase